VSVIPSFGSVAGGYLVTVTGLKLAASESDVVKITFNGVENTVVSYSAVGLQVSIVVSVAAGHEMPVDVVVTSQTSGVASKACAFTYLSCM